MFLGVGDDDASSVSSVSTQNTTTPDGSGENASLRNLMGHRRSASTQRDSPRASGEYPREKVVLYREDQRVSLRAFLRTFLQNEQIAASKAMQEFLTTNIVTLNEEEKGDIRRRKDMDEKRIEEQRQFYEIARQRARELDVYMEKFRRDIVESSRSNSINSYAVLNFVRWIIEAFQRNQGQGENRRLEHRISEVCRMVTDRVSRPHCQIWL